MLSSPELPTHVRATILTYVEGKLAGLYGHNKIQLRRLAAFMADATLTDSDAWKKHPTKYNAEAA